MLAALAEVDEMAAGLEVLEFVLKVRLGAEHLPPILVDPYTDFAKGKTGVRV